MNNHDVELKKTSLIIGTVLLIFTALYYTLFSPLYQVFYAIINFLVLNERISNILTELLSGVIYFTAFIVPILLYMAMSRKKSSVTVPKVRKPLKFTTALPIIFASIAIITAAAYINSLLASIFELSSEGMVSLDTSIGFAEFIVYTITIAVIPAVCEELLFRKTIIGALSPYGEGFAIIASAVLFGLMHQNILQFFYATVAGLVIGYAYAKTRSFLCVFLIHFTNNLTSLMQQYFYTNLNEITASILSTTIITVALVTGAISFVVIMFKEKNAKDIYHSGSFEKIEPPSSNYVLLRTDGSPSKSFFLSPTVLIFTIISIVISILTIIL